MIVNITNPWHWPDKFEVQVDVLYFDWTYESIYHLGCNLWLQSSFHNIVFCYRKNILVSFHLSWSSMLCIQHACTIGITLVQLNSVSVICVSVWLMSLFPFLFILCCNMQIEREFVVCDVYICLCEMCIIIWWNVQDGNLFPVMCISLNLVWCFFSLGSHPSLLFTLAFRSVCLDWSGRVASVGGNF